MKLTLWLAYLAVSAVIAFREQLAAGLRGEAPRPASAPEPGAGGQLDGALAALSDPAPTELEEAMARLALAPEAEVTAQLVERLESPDAAVARRAARVLFERQDPGSFDPLFRYWRTASIRQPHDPCNPEASGIA